MKELTYDDNVKIWKDAYTAIFKSCEPYADKLGGLYGFSDVRDMRNSAKNHLMLIDWYEKYGLKISHDHNPSNYNYLKIDDYIVFSYFNDGERDKASGSGKYISWSDDGRQPKYEWLLNISFPTGAYIFGDDYDYQQQLFQDFIKELKTYNPDYSDTCNKSFYWKLENAKPIYEEFSGILRKYEDLNSAEFKQRKADKLRKELEKLESEL